jgi:hypothetical protein
MSQDDVDTEGSRRNEDINHLSRAYSELNIEARLTRQELREELKRWRQELQEQLSANRQETNASLSATRTELKHDANRINRKDWLKILGVPLMLVVIAAVLAKIFQDRSFEKNTLFQTQYERILSAQKEALTQYQDLTIVLNGLKRFEQASATTPGYCSAQNFTPLVEQLKQFNVRSGALRDYSREAGPKSSLDLALDSYSNKLGEVITCESQYVVSGCKSPCEQPRNELREASRITIYKHNDLLNELISRNK